jgi:peptide methionine sulfoxide reductase MsrB
MKSSPKTGQKIFKTDADWRKQLTAAQYHVTREHGTERAFAGLLQREGRGPFSLRLLRRTEVR